MRSLLVTLAVLAAAPAHADDGPAMPHRAVGLALDVQDVDLGNAKASTVGLDALAALGHGRLALIGELGAGGLMGTHPTTTLGAFGTVRIGGRVMLATFSPREASPFGVDLVLDAGLAGSLYWIDGAGFVKQPSVFFGWGAVLKGEHHAVNLELRVAAAPKLDDATALGAICRGTCTASNDAPVDFTIAVLIGVMSW